MTISHELRYRAEGDHDAKLVIHEDGSISATEEMEPWVEEALDIILEYKRKGMEDSAFINARLRREDLGGVTIEPIDEVPGPEIDLDDGRIWV
jgi:hypothetical protein